MSNPLLTYSDSTYGGQPYNYTHNLLNIYGLFKEGEQIKISNTDKTVSSIGFYVRKVGNPAGDLEYLITDSSYNTLRSGVLATAAQVGTTCAWFDATLSSNLTLTKDSTYVVLLQSPNSTSSDYYVMPYTWRYLCGTNIENYDGTNSFARYYNGTSWDYWQSVDCPFRLKLAEVLTGNLYTTSGKDATIVGSGVGDVWKQISFTGTVPANTSVDIQVSSSDDNISWSSWTTVQSSATPNMTYNLPASEQKRYGKWKLVLDTTDTSVTPEIQSVTFTCGVADTSSFFLVF